MGHLASAAHREAAPAIRRYAAANGRSRVTVRGGGQMTHREKSQDIRAKSPRYQPDPRYQPKKRRYLYNISTFVFLE